MKKLLLFSIIFLMPYAYSMEQTSMAQNPETQPLMPSSSPAVQATVNQIPPSTLSTAPQLTPEETERVLDEREFDDIVENKCPVLICMFTAAASTQNLCSIS